MEELIETVESLIDDAAALSDEDEFHRMFDVLKHLREAAFARCEAVAFRKRGEIDKALQYESTSEQRILRARQALSDGFDGES